MTKHKSTLLSLLIIALCILLVVGFYASQKSGMFIDEIYSFGLSNGFYTPFITDVTQIDSPLSRDQMLDYLTVSEEDAFRFDSVYYNQTQDVHPPLYYFLLHAVSSFFPDSCSKWIGIIPNILLLLGTCLLLYLLVQRSFGDRRIALTGAVLYGLSTIAISTAIMVRMYMLLTFLTVLLAWWVLCLIQTPRLRFFILTGITITLGLLTQYYFVFYAFFLCAACCIYLLVCRRWKDLLRFSGLALAGVALFCAVFPACFDHLFADKLVSGGSMLEHLLNVADYPRRLHTYLYSINFCTRVAVRTGLLAVIFCIPVVRRLLKKIQAGTFPLYPLVLVIPVFLALFFVAVASPVIPLRYVYNLIPMLIYAVCYALAAVFQSWDMPRKIIGVAKNLVLPAVFILSVVTALRVTPEFLYPEHLDYQAAVQAHADAPCVYFTNNSVAPLTQDLLQLTAFEEVFIAADPESAPLRTYLSACPESEQLVVYIDIDPEWATGFDSQTVLSKMAPDWTDPQLLYAYGSTETYLLTRAGS